MPTRTALRLPVVALGAEYLTIGHLMRRNVLAYKAPPNNEGYDLICIHPNPKESTKTVRVQVKSRYQTDCDGSFPVNKKSFGSFDYLVVVFLNIGYFFHKSGQSKGDHCPEFYTLPSEIVEANHYRPKSGFEKVRIKGLDLAKYKNELGFEQIANDLGIAYPARLH